MNNIEISAKCREIAEKTGLTLEEYKNDGITAAANCAALAENLYGAGGNVSTMILINMGEEVSCGMIIEGKLFTGDIAHITVNYNGKECTCGRKGCFNVYASELEYLASGVIDILNLFQPNVLVLGGICESTLNAMNEIVEREKYARHSSETTQIKLAELDYRDAVILGAAKLRCEK